MRGVAASAKRRNGPAGIPLGVELYRRFDGQPPPRPDDFTVGMWHWPDTSCKNQDPSAVIVARRKDHTIWTAVAPGEVFTVRT